MDTPSSDAAGAVQAMRTSPAPKAGAKELNIREERAINTEIDKWSKLAIKPSSNQGDAQLLEETKAEMMASNLSSLRELRKELDTDDWMFQKDK